MELEKSLTIKVVVLNGDSREDAVIQVETMVNDLPSNHPKELKGGESAEFWVHSTQQLRVVEVKNG